MNKKFFNSRWLLLVVFLITALIMTVYESVKELIFRGVLTPWQSHTITIIVTATIATITASVMHSWVLSILLKENEIKSKEQSLLSLELILSAVNHIVNNVLNYFQLVKMEIEKNGKLREETLKLLDENIKEADKQMEILNKIKDPEKPESYRGIYPE